MDIAWKIVIERLFFLRVNGQGWGLKKFGIRDWGF